MATGWGGAGLEGVHQQYVSMNHRSKTDIASGGCCYNGSRKHQCHNNSANALWAHAHTHYDSRNSQLVAMFGRVSK